MGNAWGTVYCSFFIGMIGLSDLGSAVQRVEKENAVVIFAQNYIKFASFKTFPRNVLKGK